MFKPFFAMDLRFPDGNLASNKVHVSMAKITRTTFKNFGEEFN